MQFSILDAGRARRLAPVLWLILAPAAAAVGADAERGRESSAVCAACHGADGNGNNPEWPKLAGQHASYLAKQTREYRSGERQNEQMNVMAGPLSDEDIENIALYYEQQPASHGAARLESVTLGERIYRAGNAERDLPACAGCHGPAGRGNSPAAFPALGGQHAQYTAAQLHAFRDGIRRNDANAVMRTIAERMGEREIEAVAEYIAGLHRAEEVPLSGGLR